MREHGRTARAAALLLFLAAYATGLVIEVFWMRIPIYVRKASIDSFAVMLTAILGGIASGSPCSLRFLLSRLGRSLAGLDAIEIPVHARVGVRRGPLR